MIVFSHELKTRDIPTVLFPKAMGPVPLVLWCLCFIPATIAAPGADEPQVIKKEDAQPVWAGRWQTDMGSLVLAHIEREVYGKLDARGSMSGISTSNPRVIIGQLQMTAFKGGFRLSLDDENADQFSGVWWREGTLTSVSTDGRSHHTSTGSKDRMPWSGKRAVVNNDTSMVYGDMKMEGSLNVNAVHATGMMSATGLASNTITKPTSQNNLAYLLSGNHIPFAPLSSCDVSRGKLPLGADRLQGLRNRGWKC